MRLRQKILEDFARNLKKLSDENGAEVNSKEQAAPQMATNLNEFAVRVL